VARCVDLAERTPVELSAVNFQKERNGDVTAEKVNAPGFGG
jgi:hypothetical protein